MVHKEFGVKHIDDLSPKQTAEAIEYLAGKAIEGEFLGKQESLPAPSFDCDRHLSNMQAADLHMNKLYYALRSDIFPALRRLGSPIPGQLNDHLTSACVLVSGIMDALEKQSVSKSLPKH